ncbi:MAG: pre-peptidase C-terminal domain-containing protein [Victivallaceae bacterium]
MAFTPIVSSQTVTSETVSSGTQNIVNGGIANSTTIDTGGYSGGTADITPPTAPAGLSVEFDENLDIIFKWTQSTDNVAVDHYVLTLSDNEGNVISEWSSDSATSFRYTPKPGNFTWHVRAVDAAGNESAWSQNSSFTVDVNNYLPIPKNVVQNLTGNQVAFDWSDVTHATKYEIQVDADADFGNTLDLDSLPDSSELSATLPDGTYNYRVRASNEYGTSAWSEVKSFTVNGDITRTVIYASDAAASDHFGHNAAIYGDIIATAGIEPFHSYIYRWDGTKWNEMKFTPDAGEGKTAGVAVSNNTVVIGEEISRYNDDSSWDGKSGNAFVYRWDGATWNEFKISSPTISGEDWFAQSVAITGDTVAISADSDSNCTGAAYIYQWNGVTWSNSFKLTAADKAEGDDFGYSIAAYGNTMIVGAPGDDDKGEDSGSVYLYQQNGTSWNFVQKLTASDEAASDRFGKEVAISSDLIVIGTDTDDATKGVYVYRKNGVGWDETKFNPAAETPEDDCVRKIAASGNTFVVGLYDYNAGAFGSALVYHWNGTAWDETKLAGYYNANNYSGYGQSVSISGNTVVIGETGNDTLGENAGCAYIYNLDFGDTPLTVPESLKQTVTGNTVLFDWSDVTHATKYEIQVDAHGDFGNTLDLDSITDTSEASVTLPDGTYNYRVRASNEYGNNTWSEVKSFTVDGNFSRTVLYASDAAAGSYFGQHADVSGDIIATAGNYPFRSYIYRWDGNQWNETEFTTDAENVNIATVAASGNTVVIGEDTIIDNFEYSGNAFIYRWDGSKWNDFKISSPTGSGDDWFAQSVAITGDTVAISADGDSNSTGAAYIYQWNGSTWSKGAKLVAADKAEGDDFGYSIAADGNTMIVGAPGDDDKGEDSGSVYVYQQNGTSWNFVKKLTASDETAYDRFGTEVAISNNLIVSWSDNDNGKGVYVYRKNGTGWNETKITIEGYEVGKISLAAADNTFAVGGLSDSDGLNNSVLVYHWNGTAWDKTTLSGYYDGNGFSGFGKSVSISGDTVVIGEGGNDASGESSGCVYEYKLDFGDTTLTAPGSLKQTRSGKNVLFDWADVSGATKYDIMVDNNADFSSPEFEDLPGTSKASTLLADGTYYWKVQACNASGRSDWADGGSFKISSDVTPPTVPTGLKVTLDGRTLVLDWADSTDKSGVKQYEVRADEQPDFSSLFVRDIAVSESKFTKTDMEVGTGYAKVRAQDNAGNWSAWSKSASVTVIGTLAVNDSVSAWVGSTDVYKMTLDTAGTLSLNLTGLAGDANLALFDGKGKQLKISSAKGANPENISNMALLQGDYYVKVVPAGKAADTDYTLTSTFASCPDDNAGDTPSGANVIGELEDGVAVERNDWTGFGDPADYYRLTLTNAGTLSLNLNLTDLTGDANLTLLDNKGKVLKASSTKGHIDEAIAMPLLAGDYFVKVAPADGGKGTINNTHYMLSNMVDYFPEDKIDNVPSGASYIGGLADGVAVECNDWVGFGDPADYYQLTLASAGALTLNLTGLSGDANLTLLDSKGKVLKTSANKKIADEAIATALAAGDYFVKVAPADGGKGIVNNTYYNLSNYFQAETAGNSFATAVELTSDGTVHGWVGTGNKDDYYTFELQASTAVTLDLTGINSNVNLYLYDSKNKQQAASAKSGNTDESITKTLTAGKYYVKATLAGKENTDYILNFNIDPAAFKTGSLGLTGPLTGSADTGSSDPLKKNNGLLAG